VPPGELRHRLVRDERGAAVLVALMATLVMTALATGLMLATMTESTIAATYRDGLATLYVADAAAELAIDAVRDVPDWQVLPATSAHWAYSQSAGSATVTATGASLTAGTETLELTAQAFGRQAALRTLKVVIARDNPPNSSDIRLISWAENP
jgi:hypothetical protein